uniref:Epidermal growth factor-like protein 6 isoform X1 n=1 Tax=Geotrypetes seraphini TaxID=260995 RepID=A0A6P8RIT6_GEOSA|nr:epidermal growth factor-like protein 6 isoform X1 [Geotrypetes seraphini]
MVLVISTLLGVFLQFAAGKLSDALSSRSFKQLIPTNHHGVCHYGSNLECCYGWRRNNKGNCEAICAHGCKYGECVGPNKCKCFPGFTGKICNQDLNECGLKPRPCEHRCMNTHGSYKCYCLNGYVLMPDGTCANSRTCAMVNCQYGCEEVMGEVRCLCPSPGLHLGPNGRTCVDIDECSVGKAICPFNRRCVNTFGSYYCKCQIGYELKYVNGRYDCIDTNECAVNTHKCSLHAECLNTQGSFKCKCKQGYRGSGFECSTVPDKSVKETPKMFGTARDTIKKLLVHKNSIRKNEDIRNFIPEPAVTPSPRAHLQPFDYKDRVYVGKGDKETEDANEGKEAEEEVKDIDLLDNQTDQEKRLRGDVFALQVNEQVASHPLGTQKSISASKPNEDGLIDCSFDQGACDWKQDTEDDFDWNSANRDNGVGYYMAVPAFVGHKRDVGRLKLSLTDLRPASNFCLIFSHRLAGERVGRLRVFIDKSSIPVWEHRGNKAEWETAKIKVPASSSKETKNFVFEAERGKSRVGEIGLDNVSLLSGPCQEDPLKMDI